MPRTILYQTWTDLQVTAPATTNAAVPLDPNGNANKLVNSFVLSIPAGGVNCFMVGQPIAATRGIEIVAGGGPVRFSIDDIRMLYELMKPQHITAEILGCKPFDAADIPIIVWDLSQIFIVSSAAAQAVNIATYKVPFI